MGKLKQILELSLAESRNWSSLGRGNSDLISALSDYRQQLWFTFVIVTAWTAFAVAVSTYLIALHRQGMSLRLLSAALGIVAACGIEVCRRIWSEWSRTQLLSLLVTDAPESVVQTVVQRLVDKL